MAKMKLVDGVFYTPEDLEAKLKREAAAEARDKAAAEDLARRTLDAAGDDVVAAAVAAQVAPLVERIEAQAELLDALVETFGERLGVLEAAAGVIVPSGDDASAAEAAAAAEAVTAKTTTKRKEAAK